MITTIGISNPALARIMTEDDTGPDPELGALAAFGCSILQLVK